MSALYTFNDKKDIIGKGTYGIIVKAFDTRQKKYIALKIINDCDLISLEYEYNIYSYLISHNIKCIPEIYDIVNIGKHKAISMELMDRSLEWLFKNNKNKMDLPTVINIAMQCINIMKELHDVGIIHRDIKPHNFMTSHINKDKLYLLDYGLSKKFRDQNNNHIKFKYDRSITGTLKYVSINIHFGLEPSRRDDLESIGYMLVYLYKGCLPWEKIDLKELSDEKIGELKMCITSKELCKDMPKCFEEYIEYCRNLNFRDIPDYNKLLDLFTNTCIELKIKPFFFWCNNNNVIQN